jgi:hypothetical protein
MPKPGPSIYYMRATSADVNRIHRDDDLLKVWTKSGKGSTTTYTSWDDWTITKHPGGRGWVVRRPDGTIPRRCDWVYSLIIAKCEAASHGQGTKA